MTELRFAQTQPSCHLKLMLTASHTRHAHSWLCCRTRRRSRDAVATHPSPCLAKPSTHGPATGDEDSSGRCVPPAAGFNASSSFARAREIHGSQATPSDHRPLTNSLFFEASLSLSLCLWVGPNLEVAVTPFAYLTQCSLVWPLTRSASASRRKWQLGEVLGSSRALLASHHH